MSCWPVFSVGASGLNSIHDNLKALPMSPALLLLAAGWWLMAAGWGLLVGCLLCWLAWLGWLLGC